VEEVEKHMETSVNVFRNGKKRIKINDLSGEWSYKRQRVVDFGEKEARDAGSERDTYKKNRGGRIRNVLGSLFKWNRLYFMAEGLRGKIARLLGAVWILD